MPAQSTPFRAPRRSRVAGARRVLAMKWGHLIRGSAEPAPVGRPDYYRRELADFLFVRSADALPKKSFVPADHKEPSALHTAEACHRRYGVYPLNFSFPQPELMPERVKPRPHFLSSSASAASPTSCCVPGCERIGSGGARLVDGEAARRRGAGSLHQTCRRSRAAGDRRGDSRQDAAGQQH